MKRVVVFTEGLGELIFIRHILFQIIRSDHLSIECFELNSDSLYSVPYPFSSSTALIHFEIISVGNDERVLSEINDRHQRYVERGYEIIGLRDMFSEQYQKKTRQIDHTVNQEFIETVAAIIRGMNVVNKIHFFFEIMELEAWLLGMYKNFERIDPTLTTENIRSHLGFDLHTIDPETTFFHPAVQFGQILNIVNINYDKHKDQMESIVSGISREDITNLVGLLHCNSFALLILEIQREYGESCKVAN